MLRVKTGCITCRIRRVKCDEAKPHCKRCISTGRKCDGYAKYQVSRKDLVAYTQHHKSHHRRGSSGSSTSSSQTLVKAPSPIIAQPSQDVFLDDVERMHFDYFRLRTAPGSNSFVSSTFWSHIVFQTSFDEPTIRHTALALSAWHRHLESQDKAVLSFSFKQYDKALHHAHDLLKRADHDKSQLSHVLTSLILFHCLQNCIGDYRAAEKSLTTGRSLAKGAPVTSPGDIISDLKFTIHRLEIHSATFYDVSAPFAFDETFSAEAESTPDTFYTLEQAFNALLVLLKDSFHVSELAYQEIVLCQPIDLTAEEVALIRTRLIGKLRRWSECATAFEEQSSKTETSTMIMALMRVYHILAWVALCKDVSQAEVTWNLYQPQFVYLLSAVEAIMKAGANAPPDSDSETHPIAAKSPFSCELGIIAPLFLVASKCRDPYLRRQAVNLLSQTRRHEGRWESIAAAAVGQRIIELEEEGLGTIQSCQDVPEHNRIMSTAPKADIAGRKVEAYFFTPGALTEDKRWRHETVYF